MVLFNRHDEYPFKVCWFIVYFSSRDEQIKAFVIWLGAVNRTSISYNT